MYLWRTYGVIPPPLSFIFKCAELSVMAALCIVLHIAHSKILRYYQYPKQLPTQTQSPLQGSHTPQQLVVQKTLSTPPNFKQENNSSNSLPIKYNDKTGIQKNRNKESQKSNILETTIRTAWTKKSRPHNNIYLLWNPYTHTHSRVSRSTFKVHNNNVYNMI